jgi:AcrR family transcriptional regulator
MARKAGTTSKDTEAGIYRSALALFARYGYAAVSMRQIAGAVGVNQAALYHYTPTKQNLLAGVLTRHMNELLTAWQAESKPEDPVAALDHFTRFHIRYHMPRPDEIFVSYMELRSLEEDHFKTITALRRDYEDALRSILNHGLRQGVFTEIDPSVTAMAILSMLTGITTWYKPGGRLNQDEIETYYSKLTLRAAGVNFAPTSESKMENEECSMPA